MKEYNEEKAKILYDFLDSSRLFHGTVEKEYRSLMNVPFVTGNSELDAKFIQEAKEAGFGKSERSPDSGRYAGKYLQCHAHRRGGGADSVYEKI